MLSRLRVGRKPDGLPVYLHGLSGRDQKVLFSVNDPRFRQIAALRTDGHRGLGGLDFKSSGVNQIGGIQNGASAKPLPAAFLKHADPLLRNRAILKNGGNIPHRHGQRLVRSVLLVPCDPVGQAPGTGPPERPPAAPRQTWAVLCEISRQ